MLKGQSNARIPSRFPATFGSTEVFRRSLSIGHFERHRKGIVWLSWHRISMTSGLLTSVPQRKFLNPWNSSCNLSLSVCHMMHDLQTSLLNTQGLGSPSPVKVFVKPSQLILQQIFLLILWWLSLAEMLWNNLNWLVRRGTLSTWTTILLLTLCMCCCIDSNIINSKWRSQNVWSIDQSLKWFMTFDLIIFCPKDKENDVLVSAQWSGTMQCLIGTVCMSEASKCVEVFVHVKMDLNHYQSKENEMLSDHPSQSSLLQLFAALIELIIKNTKDFKNLCTKTLAKRIWIHACSGTGLVKDVVHDKISHGISWVGANAW